MSKDTIELPKDGEQLSLAQINLLRKRAEARQPTREGLDKAIAELPGSQTDPDYVVNGMRSFFGDLFTEDDEARIREVVKSGDAKPSDGLKVDEIKAALAEKGIGIPEGVTLKADLAALLDNADA